MRQAVIACAAIALIVGLADPGWAIFVQRPPGAEQCKTWDCQGGIICSCCFAGKGCWICDNGSADQPQPDFNLCHWDPKVSSGATIKPGINNGLHVTPANPGGGASPSRQNTPN